MTDPDRLRTLDVLGVPIGFDPTIGDQLGGLHPMDGPPAAVAHGSSALDALSDAMQLAINRTSLFVLHCGLVAAPHGLILIPGRSGTGKSTLVAALVQAGLGYLTDEAIAVDLVNERIHPFARPIALSQPSIRALGLEAAHDPPLPEDLVDPDRLGATAQPTLPITDILLIDRRPGPTELEPIDRGAAMTELLQRGVNHYRWPADAFRYVARTVRSATVWSIRYDEARPAARLCAERWLPGQGADTLTDG